MQPATSLPALLSGRAAPRRQASINATKAPRFKRVDGYEEHLKQSESLPTMPIISNRPKTSPFPTKPPPEASNDGSSHNPRPRTGNSHGHLPGARPPNAVQSKFAKVVEDAVQAARAIEGTHPQNKPQERRAGSKSGPFAESLRHAKLASATGLRPGPSNQPRIISPIRTSYTNAIEGSVVKSIDLHHKQRAETLRINAFVHALRFPAKIAGECSFMVGPQQQSGVSPGSSYGSDLLLRSPTPSRTVHWPNDVTDFNALQSTRHLSMWDRFLNAQRAAQKEGRTDLGGIDWTFQKVRWSMLRRRFVEETKRTARSDSFSDSAFADVFRDVRRAVQEAAALTANGGDPSSPTAGHKRKEKLRVKDHAPVSMGVHGAPILDIDPWAQDDQEELDDTTAEATNNDPLDSGPLRAQISPHPEPRVGMAADRFDEQRKSVFDAGTRQLNKLSRKPSEKQDRRLAESLFKLRANRYTVQPLRGWAEEFRPPRGVQSTTWVNETNLQHNISYGLAGSALGGPWSECASGHKKLGEGKWTWRLAESIWAPRAKWSDGKDFFDHEKIIFDRFMVDWRCALGMGMHSVIVRYDDDGEMDDDGDGVPNEIEEVGAVLFVNHMLYANLFRICGVHGRPNHKPFTARSPATTFC